jgi:hypothetical protein
MTTSSTEKEKKRYEEIDRRMEERFICIKKLVMRAAMERVSVQNAREFADSVLEDDPRDVAYSALNSRGLALMFPEDVDACVAAFLELFDGGKLDVESGSVAVEMLGAVGFEAHLRALRPAIEWVGKRFGEKVAHEFELFLDDPHEPVEISTG